MSVGANSKRYASSDVTGAPKKSRANPEHAADVIMTSPVSTNPAKAALSASGGGLRTSGGAKKLIIRGFEKKPSLPSNFEEDTWAKLRDAVVAVHSKAPVATSLEELYKAAEDLCTHKLAASLYKRLQMELEQHILALQRSLVERLAQIDSATFLAQLNTVWQDHCDQTKVILSIFLFLDRTYVIQTQGVKSLWDLGLSLFRQTLLSHEDIQRRTATGLLLLVEKERMGETIDRSLLKSLIRMLSALGIYTEVFERPFLEASRAFYAREGALRIGVYETAEYMLHVEARLREEADRVNACLESTTRKPLIVLLEQQLIAEHVANIVEKGFTALMKDPRIEDLARMYNLLARVASLDKLKSAWNAWIKAAGVEIVGDTQRDKTMVDELLALKAKLDSVVTQALHRNDTFLYALKEALEHVVNCRPNRPAELIAKFIDGNLRAGSKRTEEELETLLDRCMTLFRYVQGKDVFEAFYKKDLALRLLLGKSASIDAERSMISKLKTECGANFTNKLEGMFKDIDLSKEAMVAFRASPFAAKLPKEIDMSVQVLTSGYWPSYPPIECRLPPLMAEAQDVFREFYTAKHSGRRLLWQNSLGQCAVKAHFARGRKELSLSLFQAVVLLLFNDAALMSFTEIVAALGMQKPELLRTLQSLACGKVRVLNKEPKSREVTEQDKFTVNDELTHKLFRIKINAIQMKETTEENQKVAEGVFQDRQYQIDAAIVRVMKTRKTLQHAQLISELYSHLKFPLKPTDLKKRIESLIEREYLERDPNNANIYNYLA